MLARAALRSTAVLSSRYARYSIPRCHALVRLNSTVGPVQPGPIQPGPSSRGSDQPPLEVSAIKENGATIQEGEESVAGVDEVSNDGEMKQSDEPVQQDGVEEAVIREDSAVEDVIEEDGVEEDGAEEDGIEEEAIREEQFSEEQLKEMEELLSAADFENFTEEQLSATVVKGRSVIPPLYHPRTHGIPVAILHIRSYYPSLLELFTHFSAHAASALAIPISKPTPLPIKRNMWTVLKSPFAHKKSQENFERKTYKRVIKAWDADYEVVNRWVMYLEKNIMAGVGLRVVKWERAPVGVGQKIFSAVQKSLSGEKMSTTQDQIKALSEKIVQQELAAAATSPSILPPIIEPKADASKHTKDKGPEVP